MTIQRRPARPRHALQRRIGHTASPTAVPKPAAIAATSAAVRRNPMNRWPSSVPSKRTSAKTAKATVGGYPVKRGRLQSTALTEVRTSIRTRHAPARLKSRETPTRNNSRDSSAAELTGRGKYDKRIGDAAEDSDVKGGEQSDPDRPMLVVCRPEKRPEAAVLAVLQIPQDKTVHVREGPPDGRRTQVVSEQAEIDHGQRDQCTDEAAIPSIAHVGVHLRVSDCHSPYLRHVSAPSLRGKKTLLCLRAAGGV